MLEKKTFKFYWADPKARKEALEEEHGGLPSYTQDRPDPRASSAPEWRDQIRVLFKFEQLNLNFESIGFD